MSTLPTLSATISVTVNGANCTISGRPNKAKTRIWYSGSKVVDQRTASPDKALAKINVAYNDDVLKAGEPHVSAPQVFRAGHAKAGQSKPNTGGNWTVTHSAVIDLADSTGASHRFTLMVTVTYVAEKGFVVSAKAIPQAEREPSMSTDEGLSFVDA